LDADVKIQGKHLKAVMVKNGSEPFSREDWKGRTGSPSFPFLYLMPTSKPLMAEI
jgi:hypothetical protein